MRAEAEAEVGLLVRYADAYADLIISDLDAAGRRLRVRLWLAMALGAAVVMVVLMLCGLIVSATWDSAGRMTAIAGLAAFFTVAALGAFVALRALGAHSAGVLPITAQEWRKDRLLLTEYLGRSEDGAT